MTSLNIDPRSLTEEQLAALKLIDPGAYAAEKKRRFAYPSVDEGLDHIEDLGQKLEAFIAKRKRVPLLRDYVDPLLDAIARTKAARNG